MAGDWLKMEASTPDKAEVLAITASMGWDDPDLTVGKLFRVWRWFDQQTTDGNAPGVTSALLDRVAGVTGFAISMQKVGWLEISEGGLILPNFDRHNGKTAKARALTARRVNDFKAGNAEGNAPSVTPALPREEKRREEKKRVKVKTTSSDFQPDAPPMILATHLLLRMKENNPGVKEPNLQTWARTIDLMIRKDNRSPSEIRRIIDWCQADAGNGSWAGWKANILSAEKLRTKFDTLVMQANAARRPDGGNGRGAADHRGSESKAGTNQSGNKPTAADYGMRTIADVLPTLKKMPKVPSGSSD